MSFLADSDLLEAWSEGYDEARSFYEALYKRACERLEAELADRRRREALLTWRMIHDPDLAVQDRIITRADLAGEDYEPQPPGTCPYLDKMPIAGPRGVLP